MKYSKDNSTIFVAFISVILISFAVFAIIRISSSSKAVRINQDSNNNNNNNVSDTVSVKETPITNVQKKELEIATYTTKLYDRDANRKYNIELACKKLNGHRIKKDEEFSFNTTMGGMGADAGYKKATGFDGNGKLIKVYGGGICQISSTLYNSVLISNLKVTERHAHSRRVTYVPKNKDATVFYGGPDLKFINNTGTDIIIYAKTNGYEVTISINKETVAIS